MSKEQAVGLSLWATESREQPLVSCLFLFPVNPEAGLKAVLEPYCSSVARVLALAWRGSSSRNPRGPSREQRPPELPGAPPSSSPLAWEGGGRAEGPTCHPTPCAFLFGRLM